MPVLVRKSPQERTSRRQEATTASVLEQADPELFHAIAGEQARQRDNIELIASENYASSAVLAAQGSVLTNKYAEGYPGHRYYGGCEWVDVAEQLAIERAKAIFKADHVNVQPHSGAQANSAAYRALLRPGNIVLAMNLAHGGHLTHGSPHNFSGQRYRFVFYGVDRESETIDYQHVEQLAREHRPRLIVAGASAYPRLIDFARLRAIADRVGAYLMVDMAHIAGLVAAGVHPSPIPYAEVVTTTTHKTLRGPRGGMIFCRQEFAEAVDKAVFPGTQGGPLMHVIAAKAVALGEAQRLPFHRYQRRVLKNAQTLAVELQTQGMRLVSGGTDNHLMLVDLSPLGITGRQAELALDEAGITANKNLIPYDSQPPTVTSGIRLGTAAVTTRGFGPDEMRYVGQLIAKILHRVDDTHLRQQVRRATRRLCGQFPVPGQVHK